MKGLATPISRRHAMTLGGRIMVTIPVVTAGAFTAGRARASKAAKSDFFYQASPKDGKSCSNCRLFTPSGPDKGTCAIIEGEVTPNSWCAAFSPRG